MPSWSYTKLIDYEQCPHRIKLKYLDKLPVEQHPAAERGTAIHQLAEDYVVGKLPTLPAELKHFAAEFKALHAAWQAGEVSLEGEWGFDENWLPCTYKNAWLRVKGDAVVTRDDCALVIDYKTGARFGNEIKHGEQVQLYALATLIRNPALKQITVELWYLDKDELTATTYTAAEVLRYLQPFTQRAIKLTTEKNWMPNPNIFTCKWCPFGPAKSGACEHGVLPGESTLQRYRRLHK